jgi:hypothetical protein
MMPDETKTIELWPCGYDARCNVRNCKAKATGEVVGVIVVDEGEEE